jgi:hypothetical protein
MERLHAVHRHLSAHGNSGSGPQEGSIAACPTAAPTAASPNLLSDAQVRTFITRGVLTLPVSELSDEFHASIHAEAERMFSKGMSLGNDIYPGISGLQDVLQSATVSGALTSLLGKDYALHPHRHMHQSTTQGDQTFHKDSQRGKVKGFRPRWVMALYVPAGATAEMGATAVVPQSHYLANDGLGLSFTEDWPGGCHLTDGDAPNDPRPLAPFLREEKCIAPLRQGSVTLMHVSQVDSSHRRSRSRSRRRRRRRRRRRQAAGSRQAPFDLHVCALVCRMPIINGGLLGTSRLQYDMVHRGTARAIAEHLESVPFRPSEYCVC